MEIQAPPLPIVAPPRKKKSPATPKVLVTLLIFGAVGFTGFRWWRAKARGPSFAAVSPPPTTHPHSAGPAPSGPSGTQPLPVPNSVSPSSTAIPSAPPVEIAGKAGPRHLAVTIQGPLETSLVGAVGAELGPSLAQVLSRTLIWWVSVPGGLRRGDKLEALFEERPGEEPMVHVVRLTSGKIGQTFAAYRFKPNGASFARFFQPNGEELELRLKDGPLDDYEQVTSLINDGRRHKGVDFKTPVGSQVRATFDGTVTRKTWHFRGNGNSLEILEDAPPHRTAIFLHLSPLPKSMHVGRHVHKGEIIAASGNTGRSFAPHLHYQLMHGPKLLNPFRVHATYRKTLAEKDRDLLAIEIHRLDGLLAPAMAGK